MTFLMRFVVTGALQFAKNASDARRNASMSVVLFVIVLPYPILGSATQNLQNPTISLETANNKSEDIEARQKNNRQ